MKIDDTASSIRLSEILRGTDTSQDAMAPGWILFTGSRAPSVPSLHRRLRADPAVIEDSILQRPLDEPLIVGEYARMRRTTISLPDDLATALEREARRRRVPVSQVAREAIEARLGLSDEGPRDLPFIGIAESRDSEWSAADLDEFLAQTWADEIERDAFNRDR